MKFTESDRDYLNLLNNTGTDSSNIYLTAQHGYMRNLDRPVLKNLEAIYKRVINPKFTLCYHCGRDVMNMVLALYRELEKNPVAIDAPQPEPKKAKKKAGPVEQAFLDQQLNKIEGMIEKATWDRKSNPEPDEIRFVGIGGTEVKIIGEGDE